MNPDLLVFVIGPIVQILCLILQVDMLKKIIKSKRFPAWKVMKNGCWRYSGRIDKFGYGVFWSGKGESSWAHRLIYEKFKGPIPKNLILDHLCRDTMCVNPDHLEPVTNKQNLMRGYGVGAINARKTHCLRGHAFKGKNLYRHPSGGRQCRLCARIRKGREKPKETIVISRAK